MGCVPSKGEVLPSAQAKTEYQHALPSAEKKSGSDKSGGGGDTARKSATEPAPAGEAVANGTANGKASKKGSQANGLKVTDHPGELTDAAISNDYGKTEATDISAHAHDHPETDVVDKVEGSTDPAADATPTLVPEQVAVQPIESDPPEEARAVVPADGGGGEPADTNRPKYLTNSEEEEVAAILIQSFYRGHLVRRDLKLQTPPDIYIQMANSTETEDNNKDLPGSADETKPTPPPAQKLPDEEIDIDLKDPDVEKAALKIQGAFKGLKMKRNSASSTGDQNS